MRTRRKNNTMVWVYGIGGLLLFSSCNAALTAKKEPPPPRAIAPAPYVPSAAEQAAAKKQAADDAKFWATKEKKEQNAVAAYEKQRQADAAQWQEHQALLSEVHTPPPREPRLSDVIPGAEQDYRAGTGSGYRTPPPDGRAKTQHVRGHMRNGKWVNGYDRRH